MSMLRAWGLVVLLRIYIVIALIIATVFAPLALSFVPVLLLLLYLFLWRWPVSTVINLLRDYFAYFAIAILLVEVVGHPVSFLMALPVLVLVNRSLEDNAEFIVYRETEHARSPTSIYLALSIMAILALAVSLLLGSLSLILASAAAISYLGILGIVIFRRLSLKPVEETQVKLRMVSGTEDHLYVRLITKTGIGGLLFLESPYDWLKVSPSLQSLRRGKLGARVSLSPTLAGPSTIKLKGQATDRWGLIRVNFELEPIQLNVIPRARYAAWLVERYLAGTKLGALPLISNLAALKVTYGLRSGVEYYGSQLYQPGDSLKQIDWKHSLKYNELISKEYTEFHGQPAIVLINLAVSSAEEADKLAYNIIATAISLAQENIPTSLAAYDHESVKVTTPALHPRQLILKSLQVAQEMVTFVNPVKYLGPPDVTRLRANISRIRLAESKAATVLAELLQLEYKSLGNTARHNPATKALTEAFMKVDKQSNIVVISHRNHDAEALAFNTFSYNRKGNAVISV
jgi:uncharacterized protein (DUF58 family)